MFLNETELHSELRRSACYKDYLNYQNVIEKYDKCVERLNFVSDVILIQFSFLFIHELNELLTDSP